MIGVPTLLVDVLGAALEGMAVAGAYQESKALAAAVEETGADFLVMVVRPGWNEELVACLEHHPRLRALAIDRDERGGVICELLPRSNECRPLDLDRISAAIAGGSEWRFETAR